MKQLKFKYFHLILTVAVFLLVSACMKDNGNYNYQLINRVELSDDKVGESVLTSTDRFAVFPLSPTIKQNVAKNEDNLSFEWTIRDNTVPQNPYDVVVLSNKRNLDAPIEVAPGIYRIIYKVTDKLTDVSTFLYFNIKVVGEYTEGWLLLEETAQGGDLSMILPTDRIVRNIYSKENGGTFEKPCVGLNITPSLHDNGGQSVGKKVFVLTQNNGFEVDYQTYFKLSSFDSWFVTGTAPRPIKPQLYKFTTTNYGGLVNNDQYHVRLAGGYPGAVQFGGAMPAPIEPNGLRLDYSMAPFIVGGQGNVYQVVYDNFQKRFLYLTLNGLTAELRYMPDYITTDAFDPKSTGMTMLYMDNASILYQHNALMKDASNTMYFIKFRSSFLNGGGRFPIDKEVAPAELNNFSACASATLLDHMFVGVGNKIYKYDIPANSASVIYTFSNGNETAVTMRMFNLNNKNQLVVSTYDGTQGRVYYFDIATTGNFTNDTFVKKFEGFGKIVDLQYKN